MHSTRSLLLFTILFAPLCVAEALAQPINDGGTGTKKMPNPINDGGTGVAMTPPPINDPGTGQRATAAAAQFKKAKMQIKDPALK